MTYDPKSHGADCDNCSLRNQIVVPPENGTSVESRLMGTAVAVVGEAPGEQEERQQRPFVGPSGNELDRALRMGFIKRRDTLVTNVLLCRPKDNRLREHLVKLNNENKALLKQHRVDCDAAEKEGHSHPLPPKLNKSPIDCCKPRLDGEIEHFQNFITLGKTATQAVTGASASIMAIRGGLMTLEATDRTPARKVMPTIHPAFCLRQPRWFHVFRNDVVKAGKWFRGEAEWVEPTAIYNPPPEELDAFLFSPDKVYTFDIETDAIECLTANIRCIAVGDENTVMVCGFLSIDGSSRFYSPRDERLIQSVFTEFFQDENRIKVGQNIGYYDKLVLQERWGITVKPIVDTMLLHRCVESELPHNLAYIASLYTTAPSWKTDREGNKAATGSEGDLALHTYCVRDTAVTARVLPPLMDQVRLRDQLDVWRLDQKMQAVCADMHTVGMYVDQEARLKQEKALLTRRHDLLKNIRDFLGNDKFNPGSIYQLRDLLFDDWGLEPPVEDDELLTAAGDPSTADIVLRSLLSDPTVPDDRRGFIKLVRYYRKVQKVLGTYVVKLRPNNFTIEEHLGWDEDEDWADKETRDRYGLKKMGIVNPNTGRMHPGWTPLTVTGRLSSSRPLNAMNFPRVMRAMVVAQPGHVLIGADANQLEIRVAAGLWKIKCYLQAFREGKDPHSMTAFIVFGDRFCKAAGIEPDQFDRPGKLVGSAYDERGNFIGEGEVKELRSLSKNVHFASQYMAGIERVLKMIQATEVPTKGPDGKPRTDGTTDLPYALLTLRKVRKMRDDWMKGAPEYEKGWHREIHEWKRVGYLREPVTGRRRDFLDGEDPNELVNFSIQSGAAGLMNLAMIRLHEEVPRFKWGPGTGIINQCHDSIVIECPADGISFDEKGRPVGPKDAIPFKVARLLEECMNQTCESLPGVEFTATAQIGLTWKAVG